MAGSKKCKKLLHMRHTYCHQAGEGILLELPSTNIAIIEMLMVQLHDLIVQVSPRLQGFMKFWVACVETIDFDEWFTVS